MPKSKPGDQIMNYPINLGTYSENLLPSMESPRLLTITYMFLYDFNVIVIGLVSIHLVFVHLHLRVLEIKHFKSPH